MLESLFLFRYRSAAPRPTATETRGYPGIPESASGSSAPDGSAGAADSISSRHPSVALRAQVSE
jgi:hypothetical protein